LLKAAERGHIGAMHALAMEHFEAEQRGLPSQPR
jgi:hypothetical protein